MGFFFMPEWSVSGLAPSLLRKETFVFILPFLSTGVSSDRKKPDPYVHILSRPIPRKFSSGEPAQKVFLFVKMT